MSNIILLQAADSAAVTWISADRMAALLPVPLTDGRSILGAEVLADPAHLRVRVRLQGLAQADYSDVRHLLPATRATLRFLGRSP